MPNITEPLADVPELPSLEKDHPEYGTCPNCIQAKRITKNGWLPDHNTMMMVHGPSMKATFRCPGSGHRYAEYGEHAQFWNLSRGNWEDFPLEIPVIIRSHPKDGITEPTWRLVEVRATPSRRRALAELIKNDRFRIDLAVDEKAGHGALFALKLGDAGLLYESHASITSIFDNPVLVVTMTLLDALVDRLEGEQR